MTEDCLHLIGIDIGTQGVKAVLVDQHGVTLATAFRSSVLNRPSPGVVEEDPELQLKNVCEVVGEVTLTSGIKPDTVAGIGIDGQMAGIIGIGKEGHHLTPYDSWLDTRCAPYIDEMRDVAGQEIILKTGGPASFNHGPKILWWQRERPEIYKNIASFVQPGGYVAMRLCGLGASDAFIDTTYLHFSGFADNVKGQWDADLCRTFGVDLSILPEIVDPSKVIGRLNTNMAASCGLPEGIPVVAGCGDTAASFLACGATREGVCVDVAGTASVFAGTTETYAPDIENEVLGWGRSATPGLWHPYAYINGGGMNLEWFRKELATRKGEDAVSLEVLNTQTENLHFAVDDPLFVPHLGGRNSPSWPKLRGAWAGLDWSHSLAHMYRAVLEGVALEYGVYRDALTGGVPDLNLREVRVTGGGEKSALWNRIKADVLGVDVVQVTRGEGAPLGAALLAGYGVGLFNDLNDTAARWIGTSAPVQPDSERRAIYDIRLKRYKKLLQCLHLWENDHT